MSKKISTNTARGTVTNVPKTKILSGIVQILSKIAAVSTGLLLANSLLPEEYGKYAIFMSVTSILFVFPMAGVPHILTSSLPRLLKENDTHEIWNVLRWSQRHILVLGLITGVLFYSLSKLYNIFDFSDLVILAIVLVAIFRAFQAQLAGAFNGLYMTLTSLSVLNFFVPMIVLFNCLFLLLIDALNYKNVILVNVGAYAVVAIFGRVFLYRALPKKNQNKRPLQHSRYRVGFFAALVIVLTVNAEITTLYLGSTYDPAVVGNFRVALQATTLLSIATVAIATFYQPRFSRLYFEGELQDLKEHLRVANKLIMRVNLPIIVLLFASSGKVMSLLFGDNYALSSEMLQIVLLGQIPIAIWGASPALFNMTNNQKTAFYVAGGSLLLNVVSLILLEQVVPIYSAAISYSISSSAYYLALGLLTKRMVFREHIA